MVSDRSDWCVSRQRTWGLPIPIFYCTECGEYHIDEASVKAVSDLFRKEGSNAWYIYDAKDILPAGTKCKKCGNGSFTKENDIMDVWFDSGSTHSAVVDQRSNLSWPSDLVLEGNDQYRGWFQSSLLTSVAWKGKAPYKAVCTHGWVVDGKGKKQSKSAGNGIAPEDIINEYGADILRLWVASSDYHTDIRISKEILKQLSEAYRKIRNTSRFILGNISDFSPNTDAVDVNDLLDIDKLALSKLNDLTEKVKSGYENLEFHTVYHSVHNFCVVDMSNFYLDIIKDRLYVENKTSLERRSAQTAMHIILSSLTRLIAPVLAFTSQEIWSYLPHHENDDCEHVLFNQMPENIELNLSKEFSDKWDKLNQIYDDVKKALELARKNKVIGSSLDAEVTLFSDDEKWSTFIKDNQKEIKNICIVSSLDVKNSLKGEFTGELENISITVIKSQGTKCERCWTFSNDIGENDKYPTLCTRCSNILG